MSTRRHTFMFATGLTGGHVFPAIAVADALGRILGDVEVVFMGAHRGNAASWVAAAGYQYIPFESGRLANASTVERLTTMVTLPAALVRAMRVVHRVGPEAVVGFGSFTSGPILLGAKLLRLPIAVAEQNSFPGFTNRLLARVVDKAFLSFDESTEYFPPASRLVLGNPIRRGFDRNPGPGTREGLQVVVLGGSQGSRFFNTTVAPSIARAMERCPALEVLHQAGKGRTDEAKEHYRAVADRAEVVEFVDDVPRLLAEADLGICRSGAGQVFELAAAGLPAIFVPFASAAGDHQTLNARAIAQGGGALVIPERPFDGALLTDEIVALYEDRARLTTMAEAIHAQARPTADEDIARAIVAMVRAKTGGAR